MAESEKIYCTVNKRVKQNIRNTIKIINFETIKNENNE